MHACFFAPLLSMVIHTYFFASARINTHSSTSAEYACVFLYVCNDTDTFMPLVSLLLLQYMHSFLCVSNNTPLIRLVVDSIAEELGLTTSAKFPFSYTFFLSFHMYFLVPHPSILPQVELLLRMAKRDKVLVFFLVRFFSILAFYIFSFS